MIDAAEILLKASKAAIPLTVIAAKAWPDVRATLAPAAQALADAHGFSAAPLSTVLLSDGQGSIVHILVGAAAAEDDPFALGAVCSKLPAGTYRFASPRQRRA